MNPLVAVVGAGIAAAVQHEVHAAGHAVGELGIGEHETGGDERAGVGLLNPWIAATYRDRLLLHAGAVKVTERPATDAAIGFSSRT